MLHILVALWQVPQVLGSHNKVRRERTSSRPCLDITPRVRADDRRAGNIQEVRSCQFSAGYYANITGALLTEKPITCWSRSVMNAEPRDPRLSFTTKSPSRIHAHRAGSSRMRRPCSSLSRSLLWSSDRRARSPGSTTKGISPSSSRLALSPRLIHRDERA